MMIIIFWEMVLIRATRRHLPEDDNHHNLVRFQLVSVALIRISCLPIQRDREDMGFRSRNARAGTKMMFDLCSFTRCDFFGGGSINRGLPVCVMRRFKMRHTNMSVKFSALLLLQSTFRQTNLRLTLVGFSVPSAVSLERSCDATRLFSRPPFCY
jgi:hypothetical protein